MSTHMYKETRKPDLINRPTKCVVQVSHCEAPDFKPKVGDLV